MKVFVEQTGAENEKNVFDKKTGEFLEAVPLEISYPYPYGYIFDTLADDGDNLDCYILTNERLVRASVIECRPVGVVEWFEDGNEDHKILAVLQGDEAEISQEVIDRIAYFAQHFFDGQPEKKYRLGRFLGKDEAEELIWKCSKGRV